MAQLFNRFFPKWIREIKKARAQSNISREDESDHTDAILALFTASLKGVGENIVKIYELNLHEDIAEIFLKT